MSDFKSILFYVTILKSILQKQDQVWYLSILMERNKSLMQTNDFPVWNDYMKWSPRKIWYSQCTAVQLEIKICLNQVNSLCYIFSSNVLYYQWYRGTAVTIVFEIIQKSNFVLWPILFFFFFCFFFFQKSYFEIFHWI